MIAFLLCWLIAVEGNPAGVDFNKTLRLDLHHMGNHEFETFSLFTLVDDGPWPGHHQWPHLDTLGFGLYQAQVWDMRDPHNPSLVFSQGFNSLFGEWQTTAEAKTQWRAFEESLRLPWVEGSFSLKILKRNERQEFVPLWEVSLDQPLLRRNAQQAPQGDVVVIHLSGPPETCVDLVLLADGYTSKERAAFVNDARRLTQVLLETHPFSLLKHRLNVRSVFVPSDQSGVHQPVKGKSRRNALGSQYSSFGSERYILSERNGRIRDVAATVPYEFTVVLINESQYGGGGIYGVYATCAAGSVFAPYLFVHELGHHLTSLADEYYTSAVAYEKTTTLVEPWEANITTQTDRASLKWADLIADSTPLPTPWPKSAYDEMSLQRQQERETLRAQQASESRLNALFRQQIDFETQLFAADPFRETVGCFEGAGYQSQGLYRSQMDCIMFSRNTGDFCQVCARTIEQMFDQVTGRIKKEPPVPPSLPTNAD
jgi:hypothetical protein